MICSRRIRLIPTKEQEVLFWKSAGVARWSYNYFLSENERVYNEYVKNGNSGIRYIKGDDVRKYINNVLKKTTHTWLNEVGSNVMKQAVKDAEKALQEYLSGNKGKPYFKSKHKSQISFYVNYESLRKTQNGFRGEKIGFVKTARPLPKIPKNCKYSNPRITYDGKNWYISVGYEVSKYDDIELSDESIGIDVGVEKLAVLSNGKIYDNVNKNLKVRNLNKRLKREIRKVNRKIENNILYKNDSNKPVMKKALHKCKNINKQNRKIKSIYKKISDIRLNYIHQTTCEIVKTKPFRIVVEDLNIIGMLKNHHIAKALQEQHLYEFFRQLEYKSERYGIKFIKAPRFYPSSKICSCCGNKKVNLRLSERMYHCDNCGLTINRDLNASKNLSRYVD